MERIATAGEVAEGARSRQRFALMKWCEEHRVDYVFGLARNQRLEGAESELEQPRRFNN